MEGNGMAGCAGMVEIPLADIAFDRDFRRLYQTYRFDDPFVCKYDGRTFDYLSTDCADICIRGFGGSGYCRSTVIAVLFAVFMNVIDFLICFIQAYVFMMLSTIFISLARVGSKSAS